MKAVIHKLLLKDMTPSKAKEPQPVALFAAIMFTFVAIASIGLDVKKFGLHNNLEAKVYDAISILLSVVSIPIFWTLYSCIQQWAAEGE